MWIQVPLATGALVIMRVQIAYVSVLAKSAHRRTSCACIAERQAVGDDP
jgi:hypothetical protein